MTHPFHSADVDVDPDRAKQLIEDGEVTRPVRNFRFTQSYAQALATGNVLGVGRTAAHVPGDTYTATSPRWSCPALHLASWNFTGGASG